MLDVEQPKQQILTSIQRVDEKIRVLEEMNQDIGNLIKILEPFTSMLTLVFSPGSGFGVVKIAELLAEIEAVA
jgi:ArsR family metal-binding transcriptional regulator